MAITKLSKASFTVELALLMPLFLLVILSCISLSFYVHNRCWLTAAAYESALIGSRQLLVKDGTPKESTQARAQLLLQTPLYGAENLQLTISQSDKQINVQFDADTNALYGGFLWHLTAKGEVKQTDPVSFIWKAKGLEGISNALRRN